MTFQAFDSFEEMMEHMQKAEEAANAAIRPFQRLITRGKYWMRYVAEWDLLIFGYCYTEEEMWQSCKNAGGDDEECEYEKQRDAETYSRGYRFGKAYSVVEPYGELGSTHISVMVPITEAQFEEAKSLKWSLDQIMQLPWFRETIEATR